jgi:hypothetical protein
MVTDHSFKHNLQLVTDYCNTVARQIAAGRHHGDSLGPRGVLGSELLVKHTSRSCALCGFSLVTRADPAGMGKPPASSADPMGHVLLLLLLLSGTAVIGIWVLAMSVLWLLRYSLMSYNCSNR